MDVSNTLWPHRAINPSMFNLLIFYSMLVPLAAIWLHRKNDAGDCQLTAFSFVIL
jgi:hypothetical protein